MAGWNFHNYDGSARAHLTSRLRDTDQPGDFISALIHPLVELEQVFHLLFGSLSIHDATGKGLDAFGEMVNLARLGLNDDDYRAAILNRRFASGGSGTPEEIKVMVRGLTANSPNHYVKGKVANYRLYFEAATWPSNLQKLLDQRSVAGVQPYGITIANPIGAFELAGSGVVTQAALGVSPEPATAVGVSPSTQLTALGVSSSLQSQRGSNFGSTFAKQSDNPIYKGVGFASALKKDYP